MKVINFSFTNGKTQSYQLEDFEIQKILMALDGNQITWFKIHDFQFRPEHVVSIDVQPLP